MNEMIAEAKRQHGEITPCYGKATLEECFTEEPGFGLLFWFNTKDGSTHMVRRPL
jgi:hypothetical protein